MSPSVQYKRDPALAGGHMVMNQFVLIEPKDLMDSKTITDHIRESRSVLVNTEDVEPTLERRILDFVSGFTYSCNGSITRISEGLFLIVPYGVTVEE